MRDDRRAAVASVGERAVALDVIAGRLLALVGVALGGLGMAVHVWANYEAAPLDYRFTDSWPTTAEPVRWLLAATDTVGPAPALVPGAIAFMALVLLLGTVGHPALGRATADDAVPEAAVPQGVPVRVHADDRR